MKKICLLISLLASPACYSSCELDLYLEYIANQNKVFLEAASEMSRKDADDFSKIEEFVNLNIKYNELQAYAAKKLELERHDVFDRSKNIPGYLKSDVHIFPDGRRAYLVDEVMKGDLYYAKQMQSMKKFYDFYLRHDIKDSEQESWREFLRVRKLYDRYLMKSESMPLVLAAFSKKLSDVCGL